GDFGSVNKTPAEGRDQIGMLDEILADAALALAAIAAHTRSHVGLECDALLLAVIADVDAGLSLPLHHVGDRAVHLAVYPSPVDCLTRLALDQQFGQRLVARQAADVGRQDAVAAGDHGVSLSSSWPDLIRPSTSFLRAELQDVDAR